MEDTPVNGRKIILQPIDKPKLDVGESSMFSKKVDKNLWEAAADKILPKKSKDDSLQSQIFKFEQQAQQYEEILSNSFGKKLDINC